MKTNKYELKTKNFFELNGIILSKIQEGLNKSPDFEGEDVFVEVKRINPKEIDGLQNDSSYNAIRSALEQASRQFRSVDSDNTKCHIIVIFSSQISKDDIYCVWTGKFSKIIPKRILASSKILSWRYKKYIDLVIWFSNYESVNPSYIWSKQSSNKCKSLGKFVR